MADSPDIKIRITADGSDALNDINRVDRGLDGLDDSSRRAGVGVDSLTNSLLQLNLGAEILTEITARMGDVARMADEWNNLQARIKLVSESSEEAATALDGVRRVADATYTDVSATGDLYVTLARALKSLGD
jgi:methyl-accepting chemotaxis protein